MEEARLSEGTIRYRDEGSGEPLLFAHGLLVNGRLWDGLVERLNQDFRCVVPELPLGSHTLPMDPDADLSPPGVARTLAELIERLELGPVTLVGNDSGGAISQILATTRPELVGRLVLTNCDTYENFPPKLFAYLGVAAKVPGALAALSQSMRIKALRRSPLAFGVLTESRIDDELLDSWIRPGLEDAAVRRDTRKFIRGVSPSQTVEAARRLEAFAAPTLFAWAPGDRWFRIADAERLSASMPDARVERIAGSKTFVPIDQPQRLAEAVVAFMRETEPASAAAPV
ncbi:MAG: alpha/beta hydrolase [Actinomycetota bacterium]|nr:alpha/beta hydrolase [Actinomycetota bacterium]